MKKNEKNKGKKKKKLTKALYECQIKITHLWIQIVSHVAFCLLTNMFIPKHQLHMLLKLVSKLVESLSPFLVLWQSSFPRFGT